MSKFVPLRKYIFDRLYHAQQGYFCKNDYQVGQLSTPIDFKSLIGFDDYQQQLYKRYPKNAWLTPSQIFKPYYGMSIGNYIKQASQKNSSKTKNKNSIRIIQAGAGTGSAAQSILYYFQNFAQEQFHQLQYTIVQISPSLCQHMRKKLSKSYPRLIQNKQIKIINQDILSYQNKQVNCFMLFFEVLDNLPHDKVIKTQKNSSIYNKCALVDLQTNQEKQQNIDVDPLIRQCLQLYIEAQNLTKDNSSFQKSGFLDKLANKIFDKYYKPKVNKNELFLPTSLLQLMKNLKNNVPHSNLVISDFDHLISPISGINAPIVSRKGEGSAQKNDFSSYLVGRGQADIFFPVDFELLKHLHQQVLGKQAQVVKSYEFFEQFSHEKWSTSKSGFNPIKQDFSNTSFLVSKI